MTTKIAAGIEWALEEGRKLASEKDKPVHAGVRETSVSQKLKLAAEKIRSNGVDVTITDLQEFMGRFQA